MSRGLRRVRKSLQEVADHTGHRLIAVRTNLRSHPVFNALNWEITHIAALAAVAHTLGERLGTMVVADSDAPPPFGSHPDLDPLWSSESVTLRSFGAGHSRLQRVAAIRDGSPLRGHLRVCWENRAESLNCGGCKKCLLTRLQLLAVGDPTGMDSFPDAPLVETLERLLQTEPGTSYPHFWRETPSALRDARLRALIEELVTYQPPPRWKKRLKRLLHI